MTLKLNACMKRRNGLPNPLTPPPEFTLLLERDDSGRILFASAAIENAEHAIHRSRISPATAVLPSVLNRLSRSRLISTVAAR